MNFNVIPTENVKNNMIDKICGDFPFIKRVKIGESVCGRKIEALSVGNFENSALWVGAHHGLEWMTTLVILKFLNDICKKISLNSFLGDVNISKRLEKRGITLVPCLNPDGVEISLGGFESAKKNKKIFENMDRNISKIWQANANGVDLNHNYDAGWDELHELEQKNNIIGPSHTRYGGKSPESEPEVRALTEFCRKRNFDYAFAFHSQGEEIYWNYGKNTPKFSERFAEIFAEMTGYAVSFPEGLAVGGGFKDWFIEKFQKPAFTIEIGKGKNPLPIYCFSEVYSKLEPALYMSALI